MSHPAKTSANASHNTGPTANRAESPTRTYHDPQRPSPRTSRSLETGYISSAGFFDRDVRERNIRAPGMHQRIADAIRRGKVVCNRYGIDLFDVDYYELADRPVEEIRELLSMPPKSSGTIEGGSAGLFDQEGMSENQRRFVAQRRGDHT